MQPHMTRMNHESRSALTGTSNRGFISPNFCEKTMPLSLANDHRSRDEVSWMAFRMKKDSTMPSTAPAGAIDVDWKAWMETSHGMYLSSCQTEWPANQVIKPLTLRRSESHQCRWHRAVR